MTTRTVRTDDTRLALIGMVTSNLTSVACVVAALVGFVIGEASLHTATCVGLFVVGAYFTHVRYDLQVEDKEQP